MKRCKHILMITPDQFGYHTDDYYHAFYLREQYDITILCYDLGKEKVKMDGVKVEYIKYSSNKIKNELLLFKKTNNLNRTHSVDLVFARFFITSFILRLWLINKPFINDIRTGSVSQKKFKRRVYNSLVLLTNKLFSHTTIISKNLADYLGINKEYTILPLGSNKMISSNKSFEEPFCEMNVLYIGTFDNRNIDEVVYGFYKFYNEYNEKVNTSLKLIGYSNSLHTTERLKSAIKKCSDAPIEYIGRVKNYNLGKYLSQSDIGISYIPKTEYFDNQPPTKTFEYLINGLICIATNTKENKKIINSKNGILIEDNSNSLYHGLKQAYNQLNNFSRKEVSDSVKEYTWENIHKNILIPLIEKEIEKNSNCY